MSLFEEACRLSCERWAASFPEELPDVEFSKKHQRRMNALFDKMRNNKYHRLTRRATAALIAAAVALSMTLTAFAIPASREFIVKHFAQYSTYSLPGSEQNTIDDLVIGYIPEGFEQTSSQIHGKIYEKTYMLNDKSKWFDIQKATPKDMITFDTEKYQSETIYYNGIMIVCYKDGYNNGYIWNNGDNILAIVGNLEQEEMLKIITSIK